MAEATGIKQLVEKVVSQVLDSHVPQLRDDLVRRVLDEVQSQLGAGAGARAQTTPPHLATAIAAIHAGTTQREILRALLDNLARYCGRAALFIVKSGAATGWQGRGFASNDSVKDLSLNVSGGIVERTLQSRAATAGSTAEMDQGFISRVGAPGQSGCFLFPLLLKEKIAALVYADHGDQGGNFDSAALELLVASTGIWLEVITLRKQTQGETAPGPAPVERTEPAPASAQATPSFSDPFAAHAPPHAAAAAVGDHSSAAAAVATAPETLSPSFSATASPAADPHSGLSPEDAEMHRRAQRFARLLVDEIKLYNQSKVAEGRKNRDLYDRLKEDIEKSRASYQKRYGNTVAASANYFNQEVIRSLAEDDAAVMGANFSG